MPAPSASYSITMRVQLDSDPRGIGRVTTAIGEAGGTVTAVDVVESHPDRLVVDVTCNTRDADHAEQITKAVGRLDGVETRKVSDRNLSVLHSTAPSPDQAVPAQRAASGVGQKKVEGIPAAARPACRADEQASSVQVGGAIGTRRLPGFTASLAV